MTLAISFSKTPRKGSDAAILPVFEGGKLGAFGKKLDEAANGYIAKVLKTNPSFSGKNGESLTLTLPGKASFSQVILAGLGKAAKLNAVQAEDAGGKIYAAAEKSGAKHITLVVDEDASNLKAGEIAARFAAGLQLRSYKFTKYKTGKKSGKAKPVKFDIVVSKPADAEKTFARLSAVTEGVFFARDLVNEPPNEVIPELFARRIVKELKPLGVEIEILDEKKMAKLGMGAILAVGMGSDNLPRMVIMRWNGDKSSKEKPFALVGKGVTFDTGGISIKPAAGMEEMKMDMAGAAAVIGTMMALARRKAKTNVIGIVGLAENMVSGHATRPSDIITSYAGKTIEVLNTDAEGRLVLADCLTYVQEKYKPRAIINLATLTGAMMIALGYEYCGTFCNDNALWSDIEKAGRETGEKLWRMPLDEVWKREMESPVADLQNLAKSGRFAGGCTAAGFLEHFIDKGMPWAHMDIAGTAWIKADRATVPKYGTGFGVRTLDRLIANNFEKK
ncbi:MAG TPA: leucyl aminopeptidase [Alphaproteobacteria bacterium]|nr:leucyl aminopeptidase [Alphaproteobacteria bacterium]